MPRGCYNSLDLIVITWWRVQQWVAAAGRSVKISNLQSSIKYNTDIELLNKNYELADRRPKEEDSPRKTDSGRDNENHSK